MRIKSKKRRERVKKRYNQIEKLYRQPEKVARRPNNERLRRYIRTGAGGRAPKERGR